MPVAIALIVGVVVLATALIGLLWAMIFLLPFYAYVALAFYLVWRSNRKHAQLSASVEREPRGSDCSTNKKCALGAALLRRKNEQRLDEKRCYDGSIAHVIKKRSKTRSGRRSVPSSAANTSTRGMWLLRVLSSWLLSC